MLAILCVQKSASRTRVFLCCSVGPFSRRLGAGKQVGAQSGFGRCRAARGFYYKLVVGVLLGAGEDPMKSAPELLLFILLETLS